MAYPDFFCMLQTLDRHWRSFHARYLACPCQRAHMSVLHVWAEYCRGNHEFRSGLLGRHRDLSHQWPNGSNCRELRQKSKFLSRFAEKVLVDAHTTNVPETRAFESPPNIGGNSAQKLPPFQTTRIDHLERTGAAGRCLKSNLFLVWNNELSAGKWNPR